MKNASRCKKECLEAEELVGIAEIAQQLGVPRARFVTGDVDTRLFLCPWCGFAWGLFSNAAQFSVGPLAADYRREK